MSRFALAVGFAAALAASVERVTAALRLTYTGQIPARLGESDRVERSWVGAVRESSTTIRTEAERRYVRTPTVRRPRSA